MENVKSVVSVCCHLVSILFKIITEIIWRAWTWGETNWNTCGRRLEQLQKWEWN